MKNFLKKLAIAGALVSVGFFASSFIGTSSNTVKAIGPTSDEWNIKEVSRNGFSVTTITDPDTQIQYIVVYRYNANAGVALAITPRLTQKP